MSDREPIHFQVDDLHVSVYATNEALGAAAAAEAAGIITRAIEARGAANVILATGNSQLTFLAAVQKQPGIPWPQVRVFHLDEYVGLPPGHPASFPAFLRAHILDRVQPGAFYPIEANSADPQQVCQDYERLLREYPADLCALGIGENGHLAFNDPPDADFFEARWVKVVRLDVRSRQQQVGEGHFSHIDETPTHAITVTIPGLMASRRLLVMVPEQRKAEAVQRTLQGPISTECPATILRRAPHAHLYLDREAAGLLHLAG